MPISTLITHAEEYFNSAGVNQPNVVSPMPGLTLLQSSNTTRLEATIYDPVICLILRGEKETTVGDRAVRFGAGESLIVSHSLPVVSRITQASPKSPYLAVILSIDLGILRALYHEIEAIPNNHQPPSAMNAEKTGEELIDALSRYLALSRQPIEQKVMGPLILKEIHFRLLMAPHGAMLRQLLDHESNASQINKAISHLRENFKKPLSIKDVAKAIGMSESSFYERFKKITETTPLQYQKEMRLIEAQRLLRNERLPVSSVAFEVGYESPTQFSREYSRKFGIPPSAEIG